MRLKIAARKSDLARWQAVMVARTLERHPSKPSFEFVFKSSFGDQNLDIPLANMGQKGAFTEDFQADLKEGRCDLVVHSWKDLPVEPRTETRLVMTLPRADLRDILLVPEACWQQAHSSGRIEVLTSSPRRVHNLSSHLSELLPASLQVEFVNVRGNVPTRLKKMHEQNRALVIAKAGLDRLLAAEDDGFLNESVSVRALIESCRFMVLPISLNPPAPAQGALAVEVLASNTRVIELCQSMTDERTALAAERERDVLRGFGGGCHQKIGVAVLPRSFGTVFALRGKTDEGVELNDWRIEADTPWSRALDSSHVFPQKPADNAWFDRTALRPNIDLGKLPGLFVARAEAWPERYSPSINTRVWTAGVKTWKRLAKQGIWVSGCHDGLGDGESYGLEFIDPRISFTRLTHQQAARDGDIATYSLSPRANSPDLKGKTHFFWMSGTSFDRARALYPNEIAEGWHACGPGQTYAHLQSQGLKRPVKVFLNLEDFLAHSMP